MFCANYPSFFGNNLELHGLACAGQTKTELYKCAEFPQGSTATIFNLLFFGARCRTRILYLMSMCRAMAEEHGEDIELKDFLDLAKHLGGKGLRAHPQK